jgi:hypothetical protein
MAIECDITAPESNQRVGQTVCVVGSYSGEDGTPFVIRCRIVNATLSVNHEQVATVNTQEGTWQATFTGLPESESDGRGSYSISASATGEGHANPVTGVEVVARAEVDLDPFDPFEAPELPARDKVVSITGTYGQGYGLANGYVVNARLTLSGQQACTSGRLHKMKDGQWEYRFRVCPRDRMAILHVELWKLNDQNERPLPVVTLAKYYRI